MSWTASTNNTAIDKGAIGDVVGLPQTAPDGVEAAYLDHLAAARSAASVLAAAVGSADDQVTVSMSGHANPDHEPHPGWSGEFITVTVYVAPRPPEEAMVDAFREVAG